MNKWVFLIIEMLIISSCRTNIDMVEEGDNLPIIYAIFSHTDSKVF